MQHHTVSASDFEFLAEFERPFQALLSMMANARCNNFKPVSTAPNFPAGGVTVNGRDIAVLRKNVGDINCRPVYGAFPPTREEEAVVQEMEEIADMFLERGPGIFAGVSLLDGPGLTRLFERKVPACRLGD